MKSYTLLLTTLLTFGTLVFPNTTKTIYANHTKQELSILSSKASPERQMQHMTIGAIQGYFQDKYQRTPSSGGSGPWRGTGAYKGYTLYRDRAVNSGKTHGGSYYKLIDRKDKRYTYNYEGNSLRP